MDKNEIKKEETKDLEFAGFKKVDAPVIHTMPRRFINVKQSTGGEHKGIGLLILGTGLIALIAGAVFVYFYVFNSDIFSDVNTNNNIANNINKNSNNEKEKKQEEENNDEKQLKEEPAVDNSQKTVEDEIDNRDSGELEDELSMVDNDISSSSDSEEMSTSSDLSNIVIKKPEEVKQNIKAPDFDKDGLSDAEELVLGTNKSLPDSDGDGYSDKSELGNLYNPAGEGKIIVNSGIKKYSNQDLSYSLYYPKNWQINDSGARGNAVFKIDDEQFIQIVIAQNPEMKSIDDWYAEQFQADSVASSQRFYKKGWDVVKNDEGLIFYLAKPNQKEVFIVNYSLGNSSVLYFENILMLMIGSLEK